MTLLRRHLKLWVTAWILFQAVSLSAFVPRDCCAAHRVPADAQQAEASCHHAMPPAAPAADCALRGSCDGPLGMLAGLLSAHAVLSGSIPAAAALIATSSPRSSFESLRSLAVPPDSPPPRS